MAPLEIDLLTEDEKIAQTCRDYWDCDENGKFRIPVAQVAKDHGLKNNEVTIIVHQNCNVFSADYIYSNCGDMPDVANRSVYQQVVRSGGRETICHSCQEEANRLAKAERELAKAEREVELDRRRQVIAMHYPLKSDEAPDVHSLTLEDVVYILSFARAVASEDLTLCLPLESCLSAFAPTTDYSVEIVEHLRQRNLIRVHPGSSIDAFPFRDGQPLTFYTFKVHWTLMTGMDADKTRRFISMLENTLRNPELRPISWHYETLPLWQKVAFCECMEYLELCMKEHQFELTAGPKTHLVIKNALQSFSVSQVYNFIWGAVRDAAAFLVREKVKKSHAANTVVGNIQRRSERSQAEGWEVKHFRRDRNCPRTMVSEVLYDAALKIGSAGLDEVPRPVIFTSANKSDFNEDIS